MILSLVVAYASNRVIGRDNDLPWYLPEDLKRFKRLTSGHCVIMGRKTYDSIIKRLGGPLPNRRNIVITSNSSYEARGADVVSSFPEALRRTKSSNEVFVIGGESVFKEALALADKIYATEIRKEVMGDVYFPHTDSSEWQVIERELSSADDKNEYDYEFVTYKRIR
jgi:dihydrofolate reductase